MAKAKIKIVYELEYELNENYYPDSITHNQMLAIDVQSAIEDPFQTMENEKGKWTITGEIIGE